MSSKKENQDLLQEAIRLAQNGKKDAARSKLMQLIQVDPANQGAWLWLVDTCDSVTERKAILSRSIKLNPKNVVLQQALDRLNTLPINKTPSPEPSQPTKVVEKPLPPLIVEANLDWLEEDDEVEPVEELATISDEEFSKLSKAFFSAKKDDPQAVAELLEPKAVEDDIEATIEKKAKRSFFDFLKREAEETTAKDFANEPPTEETSKKPEKIEIDDKKKARLTKEEKYRAIEDELKQAFVEAETTEKVNRLTKKALPKALKRIFIFLAVLVVMLFMVMGGLFLVERYKQWRGISGNINIAAATATITFTPDVQGTAIQQTLEAVMTPSPVNFQDMVNETEAVSSNEVSEMISLNNMSDLGLIEAMNPPGTTVWRDDLRQYTVLTGNQASLYAVSTPEIMTIFNADDGEMLVAADYSDDGNLLAAVSRSMTIYIWKISTGTLIQKFTVPTAAFEPPQGSLESYPFDAIHQIVISPDNRTIVYGYWGSVTAWSLTSGEIIYQDSSLGLDEIINLSRDGKNGNYLVSYSPDGSFLALGVTSHLTVLELSDETLISTLETNNVKQLYFTSNTNLLVFEQSNDDNQFHATLWDLETSEFLYTYALGGSNVDLFGKNDTLRPFQSLLSLNGGWFAAEGDYGLGLEIRSFDLQTGEMINSIPINSKRPIYGMAESLDGSALVYWFLNSEEGLRGQSSVGFWDTENFENAGQCEECVIPLGVEPRVSKVQFSTDGTRLMFYAEGFGWRILAPRQ